MNLIFVVSSTICTKSQKILRGFVARDSILARRRVRGERYSAETLDGRLHARAQQLLLRVPFDRQRDQAIEQLRIRQTAGLPQLGVHADRGESRNRIHLVQKEQAAVGGKQE